MSDTNAATRRRRLSDRAAFRRRVRQARDAGPDPDYAAVLDAVLDRAERDDEVRRAWFHEDFHLVDKELTFRAARRDKRRIDARGVIAASRLYTPPYIVDFLLHNTVGEIFCSMYPRSGVAERLSYRVAPRAHRERAPKPLHEVRILDPCCGCGAFLLAAADLLVALYAEEARLGDAGHVPAHWVTPTDQVPAVIVSRNLWGADLDATAVDILTRFLRRRAETDATVKPNLHVPDLPLGSLDTANWSGRRFDVVVTNPPYVGFRQLHPEMKDAVTRRDPHARSDLAVAFQSRIVDLLDEGGLAGTVTPASWTTGRESLPLRRHILDQGGPRVSAALGQRVFDEAPLLFVAATVVERGGRADDLAVLRPAAGSGASGLADAVRRPRWVSRASIASLPSAPFLPAAPAALLAGVGHGPRVGELFRSFDGVWTGDNAADTRCWWELPHADSEWVRLSGGQGHVPWVAPIHRRMRRGRASDRPRAGAVEYARVAGGRLAARRVVEESAALAGIVTLTPIGAEGADRVDELLAIFNSRVGTAWLRTLTSGLNFNPGYAAQVPLGKHPPEVELRGLVGALVGVHADLATADPTSDTFVAAIHPVDLAARHAEIALLEARLDEAVCDHLALDEVTRIELDPVRRNRRHLGLPTDDFLMSAALRVLGFRWPSDASTAARPTVVTVVDVVDLLAEDPLVVDVAGDVDALRRWIRSRLVPYQLRRFRRRPVVDLLDGRFLLTQRLASEVGV